MTSSAGAYDRAKAFFQFHPLSFIDDVINASNDYVFDSMEALDNFVRNDKNLKGKLSEKQITEVSAYLIFLHKLKNCSLICLHLFTKL